MVTRIINKETKYKIDWLDVFVVGSLIMLIVVGAWCLKDNKLINIGGVKYELEKNK